jgi:hypothetical protein
LLFWTNDDRNAKTKEWVTRCWVTTWEREELGALRENWKHFQYFPTPSTHYWLQLYYFCCKIQMATNQLFRYSLLHSQQNHIISLFYQLNQTTQYNITMVSLSQRICICLSSLQIKTEIVYPRLRYESKCMSQCSNSRGRFFWEKKNDRYKTERTMRRENFCVEKRARENIRENDIQLTGVG